MKTSNATVTLVLSLSMTGCATSDMRPATSSSHTAGASVASATGCKVGHILNVDEKVAPVCADVRPGSTDVVRLPVDKSSFGTRCAIVLDQVHYPPPGDACWLDPAIGELPIQDDDEMLITEWQGEFSLTLRRKQSGEYETLRLAPAREISDAQGNKGTPYLHTDLAAQVVYFIYIENTRLGSANPKLPKVYRIEAFDNRSAYWPTCASHFPAAPRLIEPCPPPTLGTLPSQTSSSGGGEPPPR